VTDAVGWVPGGKHTVCLEDAHPGPLGKVTGFRCVDGASIVTFCGTLGLAARVSSNQFSGGNDRRVRYTLVRYTCELVFFFPLPQFTP